MVTQDQSNDLLFMRRAMELATRGRGTVSPNPMVGCVIVHEDVIIGEGWHQQYGGPHAEVNAVQGVKNTSLLGASVVYVTLEPCAHFGKTPPCADLLIRVGVRRVVVSNVDPNPLVAGKGIEKLRQAGIDVSIGLLQEEGLHLNRRFFTMIQQQRPFVILKWAQTADGYMARENYDSKWISNVYSRKLTHKWRTEEDAILVGANTALRDNPQLTARDWIGRSPVRVVIDRKMELPDGLKIFDGTAPTLRYNLMVSEEREHEIRVKIEGNDFLKGVLTDLCHRKIQSLVVEGGPKTLDAFITQGLWDEVRMFVAPVRFGKGLPAPAVGVRALRMAGQGAEAAGRSSGVAGRCKDFNIAGDRLLTFFPE